mgnify:CR=1 FL=1
MSLRKLRALVVEDELPHLKVLVEALNESPELEVAGQAGSVEEAFDLVQSTPADVLFLDIKLQGGDAFQLLNLLRLHNVSIPPVVINTGYKEFEYAQKLHNEFRDEVLYILKKPFYEDWEKQRDSIIEALYVRQQAERFMKMPVHSKLISIQDGRQTYLFNPSDIVMVKTGAKNQGRTEVMLQHKTIGCNLSLLQLLSKLPGEFVQINRFEAINIAWIEMLDHANREVLLRNGQSCSVGPNFYPMLYEQVEG